MKAILQKLFFQSQLRAYRLDAVNSTPRTGRKSLNRSFRSIPANIPMIRTYPVRRFEMPPLGLHLQSCTQTPEVISKIQRAFSPLVFHHTVGTRPSQP